MNKALIIVDVQNDFFSNQSDLSIAGSEKIIEPINILVEFAKLNKWFVIGSKDWHPESSRNKSGWKVHCIKNTHGAEYHPDIKIDAKMRIITKGEYDLSDAHYSAFNGENMNLNTILTENNIEEVYVAGVATEYCVKNTAIDAVKHGYKTTIAWDASKGIYKRKSEASIKKDLLDSGVVIKRVDEIVRQ